MRGVLGVALAAGANTAVRAGADAQQLQADSPPNLRPRPEGDVALDPALLAPPIRQGEFEVPADGLAFSAIDEMRRKALEVQQHLGGAVVVSGSGLEALSAQAEVLVADAAVNVSLDVDATTTETTTGAQHVAAYVLHDPGSEHFTAMPCSALVLTWDLCVEKAQAHGLAAESCEQLAVVTGTALPELYDRDGYRVGTKGGRFGCSREVLSGLAQQLRDREAVEQKVRAQLALAAATTVPAWLLHDPARPKSCAEVVLSKDKCQQDAGTRLCVPLIVALVQGDLPFRLHDAAGTRVGFKGDLFECPRTVLENFRAELHAQKYVTESQHILDDAEHEIADANHVLDSVEAIARQKHVRPRDDPVAAAELSGAEHELDEAEKEIDAADALLDVAEKVDPKALSEGGPVLDAADAALPPPADQQPRAPTSAWMQRGASGACEKLLLKREECLGACLELRVEAAPGAPARLFELGGRRAGREGDRLPCPAAALDRLQKDLHAQEYVEESNTILGNAEQEIGVANAMIDSMEKLHADPADPKVAADISQAKHMLDDAEREIDAANSLLDVADDQVAPKPQKGARSVKPSITPVAKAHTQ